MRVKIEGIFRDEKEVSATRSGENLRLRVTGAEETDIMPGFVLSSIKNPVPCVTQFEAQLMIVELLEHNSIFTVSLAALLEAGLPAPCTALLGGGRGRTKVVARWGLTRCWTGGLLQVGYKSVLHIHTAVEECEITKLVAEIDMKTKEQKKAKFIKTGGLCICRISVDKPICIESFSVRHRAGWLAGGSVHTWGQSRAAFARSWCLTGVPPSPGACAGRGCPGPLHAARRGAHHRHWQGDQAAQGALSGVC